MRKSEFVAQFAGGARLNRSRQAKAVPVTGFRRFSTKSWSAWTGDSITIAASKVPSFQDGEGASEEAALKCPRPGTALSGEYTYLYNQSAADRRGRPSGSRPAIKLIFSAIAIAVCSSHTTKSGD